MTMGIHPSLSLSAARLLALSLALSLSRSLARSQNGASQGQNLAVTVLCVPSLLDSGGRCGGRGPGSG